MKKHLINNDWISLEQLEEILNEGYIIELSDNAKEKITKCRAYLDEVVAKDNRVIYGINTGFGSLCNTVIPNEDLALLQRNLVLSHACGAGEEVPSHLVKRMLLLKVLGLSHGHSGVQLATVERLVYFFNNDVLPIVYQQGRLGASGDLAPLAHLSLPIFGEGEVAYQGKRYSGREVLAIC